jgi:hypothetical protein
MPAQLIHHGRFGAAGEVADRSPRDTWPGWVADALAEDSPDVVDGVIAGSPAASKAARAAWLPSSLTSARTLRLPNSSMFGLRALLVNSSSMAWTAASGKRR